MYTDIALTSLITSLTLITCNRPISLLPVLSKVCERSALNQLIPYLVLNGRLSSKQSGSKKDHSTETSLIKVTDEILTAIDSKKLTAVVLLDFSQAFDSINHQTLLNKLRNLVFHLLDCHGLVATRQIDIKWYA